MPPIPDPQSIPAPRSEQELLDWLRLFRSRRVGPSTFFRLMQEHGNAADALKALPAIAKSAGVEGYAPCEEATALAELKAGRLAQAALVPFGDPRYPALLAQTNDAPPLFWALGRIELLTRPMVALVGARNASSLGLRMARKLATDLSNAGCLLVSGMARGVDAAVHGSATDKCSVAVLAGGVDVVYPRENAVLAQEIQENGLRISEMPPGTVPQSRHFLQRNRIIAGLAQAVVVIEAAAKSGSLSTARIAADQGRDVLAVPGHPFDARASGCNMLIRDGARLVRSAEDVLSELEQPAPKPAEPEQTTIDFDPAPNRNSNLRRDILGLLNQTPIAEDKLIRDLGTTASQTNPVLLMLEAEGNVIRTGDGMLMRAG